MRTKITVIAVLAVAAAGMFSGLALSQSDDPPTVTVNSSVEEKIAMLELQLDGLQAELDSMAVATGAEAEAMRVALQSRADRLIVGIQNLCAELPADAALPPACQDAAS